MLAAAACRLIGQNSATPLNFANEVTAIEIMPPFLWKNENKRTEKEKTKRSLVGEHKPHRVCRRAVNVYTLQGTVRIWVQGTVKMDKNSEDNIILDVELIKR